MNLLLAVESAQETATPLAGLVCDVVKALMRLPMHILVGWAGAVSQMARHFDIRQNLSSATYSCTGFAEGDGLSVVAMILLDCLLHWWMTHSHDLCRTLSYADDWQMLLKSLDFVPSTMAKLEKFCSLVDLQLDKKKTFVWCLSRDGRKQLRQQGFIVGHGGRHLQLAAQHTNASLQGRVKSLGDMWDRLRLSHCPYKLKVAAWPRGLHGVTSTCLGSQILARLRSGAMRGLAADGPGSIWVWLNIHHVILLFGPSCSLSSVIVLCLRSFNHSSRNVSFTKL
jgi:hypothetical protein